MEQGGTIGRRARRLFPDGVLISTGDIESAAAETAGHVRAGGPQTLLEATFATEGYVAKADVLTRTEDGWHLIEVKSNIKPAPRLIDDLSYTLMVLGRAGLKVSKASLLLVSREFRLGMADPDLFVEYEHTEDAIERVTQFGPYWDIVRATTSADRMPEPVLITACKTCPIFSDCLGKDIDSHIFDIPRLSPKKVDALKSLGVARIEEIPESFELTPIQARIKGAVDSGLPWVGPGLRRRLEEIEWPAQYLDFETMMTALPLYADIAPYTQIPMQYSIHECGSIGNISAHKEYLGDPVRDSRRDVAEKLLADLAGEGSIVTYSNFEKTVISSFAVLFPDLAEKLGRLTARVFNLEAAIKDNYYHPDFRGSTSVKATLPALVPSMSYDSLNIEDGDSAGATFAYMAMGRYSPEEADGLRQDLLEYCGQDTLAMVKLHEQLYQASA